MGGGKTQVVQQSAPAAPDYKESMRSILQAQIDLAPQVYESEREFQPKYQALQDRIASQAARSQIEMYQGLQPQYSDLAGACAGLCTGLSRGAGCWRNQPRFTAVYSTEAWWLTG